MVKLFAEEGAKVAAVDIDEAGLKKWDGVENVHPFKADIMNLDDIKKMVAFAENDLGSLDIVCNVAGINDLLSNATGNVPITYSQPRDIAIAALWLCCDDSEMINGALVPVDGGLSAF